MAHEIVKEEMLLALPLVLQEDENTAALGEATAEQLAAELGSIDLIRLYATIDVQPETVIDLLASNFKTQYYDVTFPLETKREMVKNTLKWYKKAGTKTAMETLAAAAFGLSGVEEWFDYGGTGGHFRITAEDFARVFKNLKAFTKTMYYIKRLSAHLDGVYVTQKEILELFVAIANELWMQPEYTMEEVDPATLLSWYVDGYDVMLLDGNGNILIAD